MDDTQKYIPPIILALFVSLLPHVVRLPLWVVLWCLFMWAYLLFSIIYNRPKPEKWLKNALALIAFAGLLVTYHTRLDSNAYISLLALMAAIKPFEATTHRDRMVTLFLAYFIVITSLFQSETLSVMIYMFVSVLVTTAVLVRINDSNGRLKTHFRVSAVILLQATPVMLILFFLFPRIDGSLVGITRSDTGVTGFSEVLQPGMVSRLVEEKSVAFRVEFEQEIPAFEHLYWRGIVFSHFDGSAWHRNKNVPEAEITFESINPINYRIILEPHRSRWLFVLDFPEQIPQHASLYADFTVLSNEAVYRTKRYPVISGIRDHTGRSGLPENEYTRVPHTGNPKARALAKKMSAGTGGTEIVVDRALDYFRDNDFVYTLNPPLAGKHPIDDFLFDFQGGYCEHYSSAFAFLMRAAGVPARVVGGYLGGEVNPYGNYLIVRQSHAHAWVEVWSEKKGWSRVDPTLAVAPGRLEGGMEGALSPDELGIFATKYLQPFSAFILQARFGWDMVSKSWEAWFSGYSYDQQQALLERLGVDHSHGKGMVKLLAAGLVLVLLLFGVYLLLHMRGKQERPDNVKKLYGKFLRKLARTGIEKQVGDGPLEFAVKATRKRVDLENPIREITDLYVMLRYEDATHGAEAYCRFEKAVRDFRPIKHKSWW